MDYASLSKFLELGIAGFCIAVLGFFLWVLHKDNKAMRAEHREDLQRMRDEDKEEHQKTLQVLDRLSSVIDGINRK